MVAAGVSLISTGGWLNVHSDNMFRITGVGVCPFSHTPALLMNGPFSLTRNPMYLGLVAISAGLTLASGVLVNLWIPAAYAIWLHYTYVLPEEQFLRDQFGPAFETYAARVPRWMIGKPTINNATANS
jgi:protein-S-isoprenylcysteine O-methyltransferase Ste14